MSQAKFDQFVAKNPHQHQFYFQRPHVSRRGFFGLAGSALAGSFLAGPGLAQSGVRIDKLDVKMINRAENVIFILLTGAPSHTDTFDLKMINGVSPATLLKPEKINGIDFPTGLMPKIAQTTLSDLAIIRSMRSWNLAHNLAQNWFQVGRNPVAALGDIAPNIGSIVAIEKERERKPSDVFPLFVGLNSQGAVGSGYLTSTYAPFRVTPSATGLRNVTNVDGQARLNERMTMLETMDAPLRTNSPYGREVANFDAFYKAAKGLTYNATVDSAFRLNQADRVRYGTSGFGDACLTAKQILEANAGTRFIQISFGSWDHHVGIYSDPNTLQRMTRNLDDGFSNLMADLKASGMLSKTLIVMGGEFGRTIGRLSAQQGRDHYLQQFCVMAGAGIKGGRALGSTNADGGRTDEFGWARERDVRPEDIEATIYSALGINWTSIRYDDPFGRGFEYVPYAHEDLYGPIDELWS